MKPIKYTTGDATNPIGTGPRIIAHVCNNVGAWGAGFVLAISRRWPEPEDVYRKGHELQTIRLGRVQFVPVSRPAAGGIVVANMIAQQGVGHRRGIPLQYDALARCLRILAVEALQIGASVHMPRIGCGLAGGTWDKVGAIVEETLSTRDVSVTVYDI